jgi:hypothetical protein
MLTLILTPNAYAGNPSVATYDATTGALKEVFEIGEDVNITAYSESTPYEIIVKDSDGMTRFTDESDTPRYSKIISGITDKLGWWEVIAGSESTYYASAWYKVVPETPLGVIAILFACFASLGIRRYHLKRKLDKA